MYTNYIKNFDSHRFNEICDNFKTIVNASTPLWRGTVYIGNQPLYVECNVKWLAEKIDLYFVKTLPNEHVENAKELYVLANGVSTFIQQPDWFTTNVAFLGEDIYTQPDMIIHNNCIFVRNKDIFYISVTPEEGTNFYHLGENHLLMRLLNYIYNDESNVILHGALVGYKDYGILITGMSGAGKSTLSAYCLALGMDFVGDDRIALHRENGTLYANPIYTTLSLAKSIDGIKITSYSHPNGSNKDVFVLDKSQISRQIPLKAIIEPTKANLDMPCIKKYEKNHILTRVCMDYSYFSLLTRSTNPIPDYRKISNLLCDVDSFRIELSKSIEENAKAIYNLALKGGTNV